MFFFSIYTGNQKDIDKDFIFSTVQTINNPVHINKFNKEYFDYIIIDETHRAGTKTYSNVLNYFKPKFLLGMTATPERTDGFDIFSLFDYNIGYEIRLNRALDEGLLCPFHYFGVTDISVDGQVLDDNSDFNLLVSEERVERIIETINKYDCDDGNVRGLIFCSRVGEADGLSILFNRKGLKTICLSGKNTEEERLLGVSLTGIMDNPLMTLKNKGLDKTLEHLKSVAVATNAEWAERLGIPVATAISCVKPSGTVSQLVNSSSGIHARHSPYYIRTVRGDNKDPLTQFMKDQKIPNQPDVMKPDQTTVFSFPMKAPDGAIVTADMSAIEQLEMWLAYQRSWCEHKPSVTINVKNDEWFEVGAFVYKHFDEMSGVSFLPFNEHTYQQAPYQDCSKTDYKTLLSCMPKAIDWTKLSEYEKEDNTAGSQTLACSGDSCEIVDLV